ncbi:MAG TPA: protein phosphatase 2C domain-containing protein [Stellaceae bacterium]|nr:protein phosphatase 2C domain-containing protein [Stellaceae bacterium]
MALRSLAVIDAVCDAPGAVNEDRWGALEQSAWVLDGSTGLAREHVLPGPSDALWLMERVDVGLRVDGRADEAPSLAAALRPILAEAYAEFTRVALRRDAEPADMPCGSLAMLRIKDGVAELSSLGDCRILHGDGHVFGTSGVTALDERLVQEVVALQRQGVPHREIWQRLLPMTRRHRALMNRPEGYWTTDLTGAGLDHIEIERVPARPGDHFLLMSDGFYRLVDTYRRYTYATLMGAGQHGLAQLLRELREIEAADQECRSYSRLKPRDDATAVLVRVET